MKPTALDFASLEKALGKKLIPNGKATQALHDAVVALQANRRAGTHSTLTKATVNLSGSKPWRQKGTGRARAGYASSPVWRGGGVVFGPHPRDYSKKVSKKTKQVALKKALSELAKEGRIHSVDTFKVAAPKTKELVAWLKEANLPQSVLIVLQTPSEQLLLASRNLPQVEVMTATDVNAEDLIRYKQVLVVKEALATLAKRLG